MSGTAGRENKSRPYARAAAQIPLPVFAEQVIGGMVLSYRVNASSTARHADFRPEPCEYSFLEQGHEDGESARLNMRWVLFLAHRKEHQAS